jgi:hypothetical protein
MVTVQEIPATPRGGLPARPSWPRRGAAVVALLAPIAMVVVAAVALIGDVAIAALAVVLGLVANAAIWFALTERGARRVAGGVVAALAGAGLVVYWLLTGKGWWCWSHCCSCSGCLG